MSVKHAVLGLVIERPGYGYELIQRLDERAGGWRPSRTAVYPALHQLSDEQAVRVRQDASAHRGVTWYEATEKGRADFEAWLLGPTEPAPLRDALRMKIAFASLEHLPRLVELTRDVEQECLDRIEQLTAAGDLDELAREDAPWRVVGQAWLRRTEAAHLASTIEALQDVRRDMKAAIRRAERDPRGAHVRRA